MEKRKIKTLYTCVTALIICVALLCTATYALFSDKVTVENHLSAGTLKVKLERVSHDIKFIDPTSGMMNNEKVDDESVDFTDNSELNAFALDGGRFIAPTSVCSATMKLCNIGTIAFDYTVYIKLGDNVNGLARQLKVYFNDEYKGYLSELNSDNGLALIENATMKKNDSAQTFTVKIEFENFDDGRNNDAQNETVRFDLFVSAIQKSA